MKSIVSVSLLASLVTAVPAPSSRGGSRPARDEPERVSRADALVVRGAYAEAEAKLGDDTAPAAALLRARALRALGDLTGADAAAHQARHDPAVAPLADVELALVALEQGKGREALSLVASLLAAGDEAVTPAVDRLAAGLARDDPATLLERWAELERLRDARDPDARSRLLGLRAAALRKLGRDAEADEVELRRFLEEPVSLLTPAVPPRGTEPTIEQLLTRAERLQAGNRNERVVEALEALKGRDLTADQRCRRKLGLGLALRKLRDYEHAETELAAAVVACKGDEDRRRRARYLRAKVVSIQDGLEAVPLLESFVRAYPEHSMSDDVLFWEGDLYQRRSMLADARAAYRRIDSLDAKDDYCLEARWRLAWMSYRHGDLAGAERLLRRMLRPGCPMTSSDRARGYYWLGRVAQATGRTADAAVEYRQAFDADAMGFYAQLALTRLGQVAPADAKALAALPPPAAPAELVPRACAAAIQARPGISRAEALLDRGLRTDAARVLRALAPPEAEVISSTHASALGVTARYAKATGDTGCAGELRLYLALLLDRAGAYQDAHWRLRTEFASELASLPTPETAAVWRAAYPLAWRDEIAAAERTARLPELLLQALSREESSFDPTVVSWAGAYGLTQLLLSSGQDAGRLVSPRVTLARAEDLLDPALNARLGGALLASFIRRFDGSIPVALAAYNAGGGNAASWWKTYRDDGVDVLAEEISIQETRGYVKRVLRTYGIYRWLYRGELPALPVALAPTETANK